MKKHIGLWIIILFSFLHAFCCVACRTIDVEDEHALTLLTIAMTFILCYRRDMKFFHTIAAVILVNVLAYLIGNFLPKVLIPLMGESLWVYVISTAVTTLILGALFELVIDFILKNTEVKTESKLLRQRWVVRLNDRIVPVKTEQIAYFFSEEKCNYLVTFDGGRYIIDSTMEEIVAGLDPVLFFRINRGCILSLACIDSAVKDNGSYIVDVHPNLGREISVARSRVDDFLKWLG